MVEPTIRTEMPLVHRQTTLSRQVPILVEEPLGPQHFDLQGKTVWLLGDEQTVVTAITSALVKRQAKVDSFIFPQTTSAQEIEKGMAAFAAGKEVDVIIDCTHIGWTTSVRFDQLSRQEQHRLLFMCSEARFAAFKTISSQIKHPRKIICLTAMNGSLGIEVAGSQVNDPTYGALNGFYKGLRKEWTDSEVRIIDFASQEVTDSLGDCIAYLVAELEHAGVGVEIAYRYGKRRVVKIEDKEIQVGEKLAFSEQDTFLITGGGTGVTARILLALAQTYPVNFIVVDQVALPDNIEALAALDEAGLEQLKKDLHEQLKRQNQKVTPALLNREFEKITRSIEAYQNLEVVRRRQRKVIYIPTDIRDSEALKGALEQARRTLGPITGILHAAGIDHSHLIDQKTQAEFHSVFTVKAHGACNLMELCKDDPLRWVAAFSSISGRFGNAAQLDYCAANNFLSDWIKLMRQIHPGVHAICLDWSGWKEVGIAWRNELVRQRSEELGLNFIEVDDGAAAFMQEIETHTGDAEVVLHRGLDGFLEKGLTSIYLPDYPLIDRITKKDGKTERSYRLFSVRRDGLIDQHRLGKVPILPAVAYAELAVEYYALQAGKKEHYLLRDMTFPYGFKLFHEQPRELFVEGNPINGDRSWSVEIKSRFKPPMAEEAQIILHSQAVVSDQLSDTSDLDPQNWTFHHESPTSLPADESLMLIKNQGPEQRIILGPLFNDVLREAKSKEPVLIYPKGTKYPSYFPREQLTSEKYPIHQMFINPCFLDSLYQACAANLLVNRKSVFLPWEIGELGIVDVPRQDGLYITYAQVVEESEEVVGFNVVMLDRDGKICYFARRARFHQINL
jgi:NAD(P)-dependent dehydrogenase (short-subunit alcohol dehydrogenase family)